jgi:hypothetical protein
MQFLHEVMMGIIVAFNYDQFVLQFPEFSNLSIPAVQNFWNLATVYVRNDGQGPVNTDPPQSTFLNLVTAHLANLFAVGPDGVTPVTQLVGRIDSASQGSVSVHATLTATNITSPSAEFFSQTKYGLAYWAASSPFRTMRYIPGPRRVFNLFLRRY